MGWSTDGLFWLLRHHFELKWTDENNADLFSLTVQGCSVKGKNCCMNGGGSSNGGYCAMGENCCMNGGGDSNENLMNNLNGETEVGLFIWWSGHCRYSVEYLFVTVGGRAATSQFATGNCYAFWCSGLKCCSSMLMLQWPVDVAVSNLLLSQWPFDVAVVFWCCSGLLMLQWSSDVAVAFWCCSGLLMLQ